MTIIPLNLTDLQFLSLEDSLVELQFVSLTLMFHKVV